MARDFIQVQAVNLDTVLEAMRKAPETAGRWSKVEMGRGVNRLRKDFAHDRMPDAKFGGYVDGIRWRRSGKNARKIGGNVRTDVRGDKLQDISGRIGISKFLAVHERGATIKGQPFLFIRDHVLGAKNSGPRRDDKGRFVANPNAGKALVWRRVRNVTLLPRLGFIRYTTTKAPQEMSERLSAAMERAMHEAFVRNVNGVTRAVESLVR